MLQHPVKFDYFGYTFLSPVKSFWRRGYHTGLDYNRGSGNSDIGNPVYPLGKGRVIHASNVVIPGWGRLIVIEHEFIDEYDNRRIVWCRFAHLHRIFVKKGQLVGPADRIADVGKSGTTFAHLHCDVSKDRKILQNFYQYIWGWSRDRVKTFYADIHFMVANWHDLP